MEDPKSEDRKRTATLWALGNMSGPNAADEILPLVYDELRELARVRMSQERNQTIQATALVHEAYLRLIGDADPGWNGRSHFFGAASLAMRRILVEQARRKGRDKHGGKHNRVETPDGDQALEATCVEPPTGNVLGVDAAVRRLEAEDPRKGMIVNLRYFAGFTIDETAEAMGISAGTVEREWRFIKVWLQDELNCADRADRADG